MGLFSFLKNAGAKVLTKKNMKTVTSPEIKKMEEEILNKQKVILLKGAVKTMKLRVTNLDIDFDGKTATVYGQVPNQATREKVILALGNIGGVANVDDRLTVKKEQEPAEFYTVKRGDSLSKIAKKMYGDPMKYKKIFEANKPMLKDPNLIYPGQTLRIPR
ncbi:MAG TPA: peptidoglycan-binding protein LysM [Phaeodactylibacter sp.]|nr:peptidoglycan-binding protein LysM [Phaeodactylibacter sp.]